MANVSVVNFDVASDKRYECLQDAFFQKFGKKPEYFCRAPGRVNIIGEHIDYCGYGVLPMAITQDIVIGAATDDSDHLTLTNLDSNFQDHTRDTSDLSIDCNKVQWYNYFMCGYRGILEHEGMKESEGMQLMLHGIVPPSAGLSSSSAFVCCSALTTMYGNKKSLTKIELADTCKQCECYIGTEGGGMDQACSILAEAGTAKYIEFNPLKCTDVTLPDGATFVISHSCVEMNKAASSQFNIRVVECRLGAQIIAKNKGLDWREVRKLGDLQQNLSVSLDDMVILVEQILHKGAYSREEICQILEVSDEVLVSTSLSANTTDLQSFCLYQRATHVYGEANRVLKFKGICDEGPSDALTQLGVLMSDSHASCRDMYECSHSKLDQLVDICVANGALGSRLTGAGWGGCAVSLVPDDKIKSFLENVAKEFYKDSLENLSDKIFATKPGSGACIYIPSK